MKIHLLIKQSFFSLAVVAFATTVQAQSLTGSYDFNGNATDMVTGLTGTVTGATLVADRMGNANSAYSFSGSAGNIAIPTASIMTNQYTYCAWVKLNAQVGGGAKVAILSVGDVTNSADQTMCVANGNSGQLGFTHTAYNTSSVASNATQGVYSINLSNWYYVVVTKTIDTLRVYVNGSFAAKAKFNGTAAGYGSASAPRATVGSRSNNAQYFNGVIDDIRIYDYAKTSAEIASDYASAVGINEIKEDAITTAFPMPFHSELNIVSKQALNYSIVNPLGQKVTEGILEEKSNTINLSMLQNGIYFIVTEKGIRKIIKE